MVQAIIPDLNLIKVIIVVSCAVPSPASQHTNTINPDRCWLSLHIACTCSHSLSHISKGRKFAVREVCAIHSRLAIRHLAAHPRDVASSRDSLGFQTHPTGSSSYDVETQRSALPVKHYRQAIRFTFLRTDREKREQGPLLETCTRHCGQLVILFCLHGRRSTGMENINRRKWMSRCALKQNNYNKIKHFKMYVFSDGICGTLKCWT